MWPKKTLADYTVCPLSVIYKYLKFYKQAYGVLDMRADKTVSQSL